MSDSKTSQTTSRLVKVLLGTSLNVLIEPAERAIHVENESNCQDRVYWKFCQDQCTLHSDVNARVAKFNCTEQVKKDSMKDILTLDQCDYQYHQVKFIDCYCKPNGSVFH